MFRIEPLLSTTRSIRLGRCTQAVFRSAPSDESLSPRGPGGDKTMIGTRRRALCPASHFILQSVESPVSSCHHNQKPRNADTARFVAPCMYKQVRWPGVLSEVLDYRRQASRWLSARHISLARADKLIAKACIAILQGTATNEDLRSRGRCFSIMIFCFMGSGLVETVLKLRAG